MALPRPPPDLRRCSGCGGGVEGDKGGAFPKGLLDPPYAVDPYLNQIIKGMKSDSLIYLSLTGVLEEGGLISLISWTVWAASDPTHGILDFVGGLRLHHLL